METSTFLEFIRLVVAGDTDRVARRLSAAPALATTASPAGATRQQATAFFFTAIAHYLYAGDTALHMAAAAAASLRGGRATGAAGASRRDRVSHLDGRRAQRSGQDGCGAIAPGGP